MSILSALTADGDRCQNCGHLLCEHFGGKRTRELLRLWDDDVVFATVVDITCAYIRLADALAGFFRDYEEGDSYTKEQGREVTASTLYNEFQIIAEKEKMSFTFKNAKSFGIHLQNILGNLKEFSTWKRKRQIDGITHSHCNKKPVITGDGKIDWKLWKLRI